MGNFITGQEDIFLGPPPWDTAVPAYAWIYQLTLISNKALEPQEVIMQKGKDETKAWDEAKHGGKIVDYSKLGATGQDDMPDPVHMPTTAVEIFDARDKVASEAGIEVLCDLLMDPLESQKRAAGEALKNLA